MDRENNLLKLMFETYIISNVGIILDDKVLPVNSIGRISSMENKKIYMTWDIEGIVTKTVISLDEFYDLLDLGYIKNVKDIKKPLTEPKFKVGDLVKLSFGYEGIVSHVKYDYEENIWQYDIIRIGHNFNKDSFDYYQDEEDLEIINEIINEVLFEGNKYKVNIAKTE